MNNNVKILSSTLFLCLVIVFLVNCGQPVELPWQLQAPPSDNVYSGKLFSYSRGYPEQQMRRPLPAPWNEAISGETISVDNARLYIGALRNYIADDMRELIFDSDNFNPGARGWYSQPWARINSEPIKGAISSTLLIPEMFPLAGLTEPAQTYVVTYYDEVAASNLTQVWRDDALDPLPGLRDINGQFAEGSIIVKASFTTGGAGVFPPMKGSPSWRMYIPPVNTQEPPALQDVYFLQLDIAVKDSIASPRTNWVFAALVYDRDYQGNRGWDQIVPLGAQWGNDPDVNSPMDCDPVVKKNCPALKETWINPSAPVYAMETLGWGGRLSGPNGGIADPVATVIQQDGKIVPYEGIFRSSSCMGCHGVAEYPMAVSLLPSPPVCSGIVCNPTMALCNGNECKITKQVDSPGARVVYYQPGSDKFRQSFQSRRSEVTQNPGTLPLDYDLFYAQISLPQWWARTQDLEPVVIADVVPFDYHGKFRSGRIGAQ